MTCLTTSENKFFDLTQKKKKKKKIPEKISVNFSFYRKFFNFLDFLGHVKHLTSLKDAEKNTAKSYKFCNKSFLTLFKHEYIRFARQISLNFYAANLLY